MKKRELSKTIGLIRRGGTYSPSNDRSEEKVKHVWPQAPAVLDERALHDLDTWASAHGYRILVLDKGLNR